MFHSKLPYLLGLLCIACQPLPEITATLGPDNPTTSDYLTVSLGVLGQSVSDDALRPSYAYSYRWFRDGEAVSGHILDYLASEVTLREEEWEVEVTPIWGTREGTSVRSNSVTVINGAPMITNVVVSPEEPGSHEDVTVIIEAVDPDGDAPTFEYVWAKNDQVISGLDEPLLPASQTTMNDNWTVQVRAVDGFDSDLKAGEGSAAFVVGNGAPTISAINLTVVGDPTKSDFQGGDSLEAQAEVSDAEGDSISVDYFWLVNNVVQNVSSMDRLDASFIRKGDEVRVRGIANDGSLTGTEFISEPIIVSNTAPSVQLAQTSPEVLKEGVVAQCVDLGFQDVDGDSAQNRYEWIVSGITIPVTTDTLSSDFFNKNQTVKCCVEPFDGTDAGAVKCSGERVVQNSVPTLPTAVVQPISPTKADVVSVDVSSASDADGDTVTAEIVWYLDGSPLSTSPTLSLSDVNFKKSQELRAVIRPHDGTEAGTYVTTSTVTIQNSVPTVTSVTVSPATAYTNDNIDLSVTTEDLDGDAVTLSYQWSIGGSVVGTSSTLDGTLHFKKDDVIQLSVTPSDGASGLAYAVPAITVQNSAPEGHLVSISPEKPLAGVDPLVCTVALNATDADGDSVQYTYSWAVDGVLFSGASTTTSPNDTVLKTDTDGGDEWVCTVTPSDGVNTGPDTTESVTVVYPWEQITAGAQHSCGIDTAGAPQCWGDNSDGQSTPPSRVFDDIDSGGFHSCGISGGNVYCWGRDIDDQVSEAPTVGSYLDVQLGVKHSCSRNSSGNLDCWGRDLSGCTSPPAGSFVSFTVGEYHGCALNSSGYASCWGRDVDDESSPPATTKFSQVSAGASHTCGILQATGGLDCWGDNASGVTTAPATTGYQRLACGKVHCCAISASGSIDCWGDDSAGQASPPLSSGWHDIDAGRYHTCAWTVDGEGECWGQNSLGQSTLP